MFEGKNGYLILGLISIVNISVGIYIAIKERNKDNNVNIDKNDVDVDVVDKIVTMEKVDNISNELSVLYSTLEEIKNKMDELHQINK